MREVSVRTRVAEITRELRQVRLGAGSAFDDVLPRMRELLGVDNLAMYSLGETPSAWELARWHHTGLPAGLSEQWRRFVSARSSDFVFYDPWKVAASERNKIVESTAWIDREVPGTWLASSLARDVVAPAKLEHHRQYRALVCEGRELLAWWGSFVPGDLDGHRQRIFASLVPAVRARLIAERFLGPTLRRGGASALEACLDTIGAPAWIVRQRDVIVHRNAAAAALGRVAFDEVRVERVPICVAGTPAAWLVILRVDERDARITEVVARAALRWGLTVRQRMVLGWVALGHSTAAIAARMDVSARAIELHITALLARAGVDQRAALTAALLTLE